MNPLNISLASTYRRFLVLLFLFMVCFSTRNVDGFASYQDDNNDGELKSILIPDSLFLSKGSQIRSELPSIVSDYDLQLGNMRIIPYKKRTIPIELQKALYAHGIVGRRR